MWQKVIQGWNDSFASQLFFSFLFTMIFIFPSFAPADGWEVDKMYLIVVYLSWGKVYFDQAGVYWWKGEVAF